MKSLDKKSIGNRLKELRRRLGISQGEVARMTGVSQPMISQIENGLRPNPGYMLVKKLERGLGHALY